MDRAHLSALRRDDPDVTLSWKMSAILRHQAVHHGFRMRPDGSVILWEMLDIDGGQFLAGWTVTDVCRVGSNDEKASCSLMDDVLVGHLIRARRTSLSRSSSAR